MPFGAAAFVNGARELAPVPASGIRSRVCSADNRYAEGALLAKDGCWRSDVRFVFRFADVTDGLSKALMTLLNEALLRTGASPWFRRGSSVTTVVANMRENSWRRPKPGSKLMGL